MLRRMSTATTGLRGIRAAALIGAGLALFVFASGLTADNGGILPDRVLGQVNFVNLAANFVDARALWEFGAVTIDPSSTPNHLYVIDSQNNRVLGWKNAPGFSNGSPADIVIGQPDFNSNGCPNSSAISASALCDPVAAAVDAQGNLYVADSKDNRVLEYSAPFSSSQTAGMPATMVFGQSGSFTSNGDCPTDGTTPFSLPPTADSLCGPSSVAVDPHGNVYITDGYDERILEYNNPLAAGGGTPGTPGSAGDTTADLVFGPSNFTTFGHCDEFDTPTVCVPAALAVDSSGNLFAANYGYVLEFDNPVATGGGTPGTPGAAGDTTIDQVISATGTDISGLTVDSAGNLYVISYPATDGVTEYETPLAFRAGAAGQGGAPDPTTALFGRCNTSQCASATVLNQPQSVAVDSSGDVYVYDYARMLEFDNPFAAGGGTPGVPGAPGDTTADAVLGQVDFTRNTTNMVDAIGMNLAEDRFDDPPLPSGVTVDASGTTNHLYVADTGNNRILGWNDAAGFASAAPADIVIGQPDFFSYNCAAGSTGLCSPTGLTVDAAGNLYVADSENARVLEYGAPFKSGKTAGIAASVVFGQSGSFTSSGCKGEPIGSSASADSLCEPVGVATDSKGDLYVADDSDGRVLEYDQPLAARGGKPGTPGHPGDTTADRVFGQSNFTFNNTPNSCTDPSATDLCDPTGVAVDSSGNLYVADWGNSRVLEFNDPVALVTSGSSRATAATRVFGQSSLTSSACDPSDSGCRLSPGTVTLDAAGNLYAASSNLDQVFFYKNPLSANSSTTLNVLFGDLSNPCLNSHPLLASATSLCAPAGMAVDSSGDLFVADAGNNRVMSFDQLAATGTLAVAPALVNFGAQVFGLEGATSQPKQVTVSNTAHTKKPGHAAKIENIAIGGAFAMNSSGSTCETGLVLAPGASCVLSLSFTPPGLGSVSGALAIAYGAGLSANVALTGKGVAGVLTYTPKSINFGKVQVGSPANGVVTLTNGNGADLGITALTSSDSKEFTVSQNCVGTLAMNGGTCTVAVTFTPASKGSRNAKVLIYDDAANSPQTVTLSGTGD